MKDADYIYFTYTDCAILYPIVLLVLSPTKNWVNVQPLLSYWEGMNNVLFLDRTREVIMQKALHASAIGKAI